MALTHKLWAIGAACGVLYTVAGCNAVLGIEPAEPDPTGGTGGAGGSGASGGMGATSGSGSVPAPSYGVSSDCKSCLATNCSLQVGACLQDHLCRKQVAAYADCINGLTLQQGPIDPATCQELLQNGKFADQSSVNLYNCARDYACWDKPCLDSELVSFCELYCACMPGTCGLSDCNSVCLQISTLPDKLECRWDHCEVAFESTDASVQMTHCGHANGTHDVCPDNIQTPCTLEGVPNGFACHSTADCCQGQCGATGVCGRD